MLKKKYWYTCFLDRVNTGKRHCLSIRIENKMFYSSYVSVLYVGIQSYIIDSLTWNCIKQPLVPCTISIFMLFFQLDSCLNSLSLDKVLSPLVDNVAEATHYYVRTVCTMIQDHLGLNVLGVFKSVMFDS